MILNMNSKVANAQAEIFLTWRTLRCMKHTGPADEYVEMSIDKQEN